MAKILDCTVRDGGHQNNWNFDDDFVLSLISKFKLEQIDYCELGYRNHIDRKGKGKFFFCDKNLLKKFVGLKGNLKIGVMADYKRIDLNDFKLAQADCIDFVRIACHPDSINNSIMVCEELKKREYNVFLQLMEIPNVRQEHYDILNAWSNKNILESLYIADSYSCVKPDDIPQYFARLRSSGFKNISFHAHNACGLALENTMKAVECGAYSIDVSQNGLGGNLSFEDYKNCL